MNLTLHIVRKDLQRLRWWLAGWTVVLLLPIALGVRLLATDPFESPWVASAETLQRVQMLAVLFGYLLAVVLLQEDRTIGTQQFWLTRPISRRRLLAAKALGVGIVLCALPVILSLPWWLWCRLGAGQIAIAALELTVLGSLVAIPAALIATLTETLSRAVLWTLVLAAAGGTTIGFFILQHSGRMDRMVYSAVIAIALSAIEMLAVIVWVALTRSRPWRLLIAAGVFPVLIAASFAFGARWSERRVPPVELKAAQAAGVTVKFKRARGDRPRQDSDGVEPIQYLSTTFELGGVPAEVGVNLTDGGRQWWRWRGMTLEREAWRWERLIWSPRPLLGLREPPPDPETEAYRDEWLRSRGRPPWQRRPERPDGTDFGLAVSVKRSVLARMQSEPPAYEAELWFETLQPELLFEIPCAVGQTGASDGHVVRIKREAAGRAAGSDWRRRRITLAETAPQTLAQTLSTMARPDYWPRDFWAGPNLIAIHRQRQEFVGLQVGDARSLIVNGVRVAWRWHALGVDFVRRGDRWVDRSGWSDGVSLALIRLNVEARFKREVRIEKFTLEPQPPPRGESPP